VWGGVAGGLGQYFEIDPVLIRVIWVAATFFTSGLAIGVYVLLWILMPRDDQVDRQSIDSWSREFENRTREFAEEGRKFAENISGQTIGTPITKDAVKEPDAPRAEPDATVESTPGPFKEKEPDPFTIPEPEPVASSTPTGPASSKGEPVSASATTTPTYDPNPPSYQTDADWWRQESPAPERSGGGSGRQRTAGVILVALGILFLAGQMGLFRLIRWDVMWPVILIAVGIGLLFRNSWRR
jgi:phage shock protein C